MILVMCMEKNEGMIFNNRRVSKDRKIIDDILEFTEDNKIYINEFSVKLFENIEEDKVVVRDDFIECAGENDICFIENIIPSTAEKNANKLVIYDWNRDYPADLFFDINLEKWELESEEKLVGFSHDEIIKRVYVRGSLDV